MYIHIQTHREREKKKQKEIFKNNLNYYLKNIATIIIIAIIITLTLLDFLIPCISIYEFLMSRSCGGVAVVIMMDVFEFINYSDLYLIVFI